jgi:hypothetical protein
MAENPANPPQDIERKMPEGVFGFKPDRYRMPDVRCLPSDLRLLINDRDAAPVLRPARLGSFRAFRTLLAE